MTLDIRAQDLFGRPLNCTKSNLVGPSSKAVADLCSKASMLWARIQKSGFSSPMNEMSAVVEVEGEDVLRPGFDSRILA